MIAVTRKSIKGDRGNKKTTHILNHSPFFNLWKHFSFHLYKQLIRYKNVLSLWLRQIHFSQCKCGFWYI